MDANIFLLTAPIGAVDGKSVLLKHRAVSYVQLVFWRAERRAVPT